MKCLKCQTENPETRKFCKECGVKLIQRSISLGKAEANFGGIGAEFNLQKARKLSEVGPTSG